MLALISGVQIPLHTFRVLFPYSFGLETCRFLAEVMVIFLVKP